MEQRSICRTQIFAAVTKQKPQKQEKEKASTRPVVKPRMTKYPRRG